MLIGRAECFLVGQPNIDENVARLGAYANAGADCLTLGNHSWDQKEALTYIVREPRMIRSAERGN